MKTLDLKGSLRLAFLPAICAGLLSGCATHERQIVHRSAGPSAPPSTTVITTTAAPQGLFDQLDTNRDGFLSRAEVEPLGLPAYGAATPWVLSFQGLDTNRDAFLSRSEAEPLIASTRVSGGRWIVITTAPFDRFDRDRDGFLNRAESAPLMNAATFERYDTNRDGFLSKSEAEPFFGSNVGSTNSTYGGTVYGPR